MGLAGWPPDPCTVLIGDCFDLLPMLHGVIDLVITDPPYESLERHRAKGTTTRLKQSDASSNPWFEVIHNLKLIDLYRFLFLAMKQDTHCYTFCDSETEHVILSGVDPYELLLSTNTAPALCGFTAWPTLTWVKTRQSCLVEDHEALITDDVRAGMGYHWRRATERIVFLEKGKRKLNNLGWSDVLLGPRAGKNMFPSQKPQAVLEKLIENSSQPGDVILDPFGGSGSTALAAMRLGRRCVIIEKHPTKWLLENLQGKPGVVWSEGQ